MARRAYESLSHAYGSGKPGARAFDLLDLDYSGATQVTRYVGDDGMVHVCANNVLRSSNNLADTSAWTAASVNTVVAARTIDFLSTNQGVRQELPGTSNRFLGKVGETLSLSVEVEVLRLDVAGSLSLRYANLSGSEVTARDDVSLTAVGQRAQLFMTFTPSGAAVPRIWIQNRNDLTTAFQGKIRVRGLCLSIGVKTYPWIETSTTGPVYKFRTSRNMRGYNGVEWVSSKAVELNADVPGMRAIFEGVAQTNLITNHSTSNWTGTRAALAASTATDPGGSTNAYRLTEDSTAASTHFSSFAVTLTDSTVYTASAFLRSTTRMARLVLTRKDATTAYVTVDIASGEAFASSNATSVVVRALDNGWVRVSFQADALTGGTSPTLAVQLVDLDGTTVTYNGDGASNVDCWGVGLAAQAYATHPVLTYGSTVTRAAEAPTSTAVAAESVSGKGVLECVYLSKLSGTGVNNIAALYGASSYVRLIDRNADSDTDRYAGAEINDGTDTDTLNTTEAFSLNSLTASVASWDPDALAFNAAADNGTTDAADTVAPSVIDADLGATVRIAHHSSGGAAAVVGLKTLRYVTDATLSEAACAARAGGFL
jgi:hypothetical protein